MQRFWSVVSMQLGMDLIAFELLLINKPWSESIDIRSLFESWAENVKGKSKEAWLFIQRKYFPHSGHYGAAKKIKNILKSKISIHRNDRFWGARLTCTLQAGLHIHTCTLQPHSSLVVLPRVRLIKQQTSVYPQVAPVQLPAPEDGRCKADLYVTGFSDDPEH